MQVRVSMPGSSQISKMCEPPSKVNRAKKQTLNWKPSCPRKVITSDNAVSDQESSSRAELNFQTKLFGWMDQEHITSAAPCILTNISKFQFDLDYCQQAL